MNERIRELDTQAQEYAGRIAGNDEDSNYAEWFNIYKEKFAELIVQEMCNKVIQPYMSRWPADHPLVTEVKKHFGIE